MSTDFQPILDDLDLDLAPNCDYREAANCDGTAAWIVWSKPCTCGHAHGVRFFCDPCWTYRNGVTGLVTCRSCNTEWPCMALVVRVEAYR